MEFHEMQVVCWKCNGLGCKACKKQGHVTVRVMKPSRRRAHGSLQSKPKVRGSRIGEGCYKHGGISASM